ncbi:hypothetical protein FE257_012722 [Aspergillus nanangensis]|uniref:Uncharacterized protein n=1 Tax=Aspergillus nanangensis TaxID=2582783 RepID=A0AAD4CFM1_ASPNN|nr:hypothetical protein FE257_012722 [Aspergillus nanangensis]
MRAGVIAPLLYVGYASAISVRLFNKNGVSSSYAVNADGSCFDLAGGTLQQFNDNLKAMDIPSGYQCVIWEDYNCKNLHTNAIQGLPQIEQVCWGNYPNQPNHDWSRVASSFKCCPAGPEPGWCAGSIPTC